MNAAQRGWRAVRAALTALLASSLAALSVAPRYAVAAPEPAPDDTCGCVDENGKVAAAGFSDEYGTCVPNNYGCANKDGVTYKSIEVKWCLVDGDECKLKTVQLTPTCKTLATPDRTKPSHMSYTTRAHGACEKRTKYEVWNEKDCRWKTLGGFGDPPRDVRFCVGEQDGDVSVPIECVTGDIYAEGKPGYKLASSCAYVTSDFGSGCYGDCTLVQMEPASGESICKPKDGLGADAPSFTCDRTK